MPRQNEPEPAAPTRRLRLRHVVAIGTGAMFSSGFFLLPGLAFAATGASMPLAYLFGGLLALPTMLAVAELSTAMPRAGGPYHFFSRSMGPRVALVGALGLWLALVGKSAFALAGIEAYLGLLVDLPAAVPGVALAVVFTLANIVGARESATLQVVLVGVLLVVLAAVTVSGSLEVARLGDTAAGRTTPFLSDGALGLVAAVGLVFVSFAGVPQIASVAGEVREPERSIPRGVLISLVIGTVAYVVGTALMVLTVPPDELRGDLTPVATAVAGYGLPLGELLVVVAALAAFASTGNAGIMSAARYPLAVARDRMLWAPFARLNDSGVPWVGVVATGTTVALAVLLLDTERIARLASAIVLLSFAMLNLSVLVLRRARAVGYEPTFRVPGHPYTPMVGALVTVPLILDLGREPALLVLLVVVVGSVWSLTAARSTVRDRDRGALVHLVHRRRLGTVDGASIARRLQELGPRPADCAPEFLAQLEVRSSDDGATPDRLLDTAADLVADRLGVGVEAVRSWLGHPHLRLRTDDAGSEVVGLLHDGPASVGALVHDPTGAVVVVLALPDEQHDRLARLCALLSSQVLDGGPFRRADGNSAALRDELERDAARRQGAEPPPP